MKCCTNNEKSVSSGTEEDITPDLEELDSVNDDEHSTLNQILQKLSDCNNHQFFHSIGVILIHFSMFSSQRTWRTEITTMA